MKKIIISIFLVLSLFTLTSCNNTEIKTEIVKEKQEVKLTDEENQLLEEVVEPLLNNELK
jgi:uncharacterized lipoprotein NlpE involved in copper resistance